MNIIISGNFLIWLVLLHYSSAQVFSRDGDINIGFLLPVHDSRAIIDDKSTETKCAGKLKSNHALYVAQFRRIIDQINGNASILGGFKLGYEIADYCGLQKIAENQADRWVAAKQSSLSLMALITTTTPPFAFVLGPFSDKSKITRSLAARFGSANIPLIDFGSTSSLMMNRVNYPLYARARPSDRYIAKAIEFVMNDLKWKCAHLIYSEGNYGETGAALLREEFRNNHLCISSNIAVPTKSLLSSGKLGKFTAEILQWISVKAPNMTSIIVCFCNSETLVSLLQACRDFNSKPNQHQRFLVIASETWGMTFNESVIGINPTITFKEQKPDVPNFGAWVSANLENLTHPNNRDPWLPEYSRLNHGIFDKKAEDIGFMTASLHIGIQALRLLLEESCPHGPGNLKKRCGSNYIRHVYRANRFYELLRDAANETPNDVPKIYFNSVDMDATARYNVQVWRYATKSYANVFSYLNDGEHVQHDEIDETAFSSLKYWPDTSKSIASNCSLGTVDGEPICPQILFYQSTFSNETVPVEDEESEPIDTDSVMEKSANFLPIILAILAALFLLAFLGLLIFVIFRMKKQKIEAKKAKTTARAKPSTVRYTASPTRQNHPDEASRLISSSDYYINVIGSSTSPEEIRQELDEKTKSEINRVISDLGGNEEMVKMVQRFYLENDQLVFGEQFGHGNFAFAYRAVLKRKHVVVVKVLKSRDSDDLLDFLKEAFIMQTFDHPNVMRLFGISLLFEQPHIVVPFMANGSLRDMLRQRFNDPVLTDAVLLDFCHQIACGMEYLSQNRFIHRDLAARNVLVDEDLGLKIADFGMSRHLRQSDYYKPVISARPLPIRWHPPESLQFRRFDERSDVWSFGVVMWEIYAGGLEPYAGMSNSDVIDFIASGNRLTKPVRCSKKIYKVMLSCWLTKAEERPFFTELVHLLLK